jgi:hypothetical protein
VSSDLERIALGLVEAVAEVPRMVEHLHRTAGRCRQQAMLVATLSGENPAGRQAALYLEAAARACEEAAHRAALAPPEAQAWAEGKVGGSAGPPPPSGPATRGTASAGAAATRVDLTAVPAADDRADPVGQTDGAVLELSTTDPADRAALSAPPPNRTLLVDGRFTYRTDGVGRVVRATATLGTVDLDHPRDTGAQRRLVGKLPGDHAGHIFARIFQGPSGTLNLVPMESTRVNQGRYRSLENKWRKIIERGGAVEVVVELAYSSDSRRPRAIRVGHTSDGVMKWTAIDNESGGMV